LKSTPWLDRLGCLHCCGGGVYHGGRGGDSRRRFEFSEIFSSSQVAEEQLPYEQTWKVERPDVDDSRQWCICASSSSSLARQGHDPDTYLTVEASTPTYSELQRSQTLQLSRFLTAYSRPAGAAHPLVAGPPCIGVSAACCPGLFRLDRSNCTRLHPQSAYAHTHLMSCRPKSTTICKLQRHIIGCQPASRTGWVSALSLIGRGRQKLSESSRLHA
jgi:hypothetical protein